MFDRAFESRGFGRPAAHEWQALLESFARRSTGRMVVCSRDAVHQHYAGMECAHCERVQLLRRARAAQPARSPSATTPHTRRPTARATPRPTARPNVRPTARIQAKYQPRAYAPIPKPNWPSGYVPPSRNPGPSSGRFAHAFWLFVQKMAMVMFFIVLVVLMKTCDGGTAQERRSVRTKHAEAVAAARRAQARAALAQAQATPTPEATPYAPPYESIVGSTDWIYGYVVGAAEHDGDLGRWIEFLRARSAGQPAPDGRALAAAQAQIDAYARGNAGATTPQGERNAAREQLRRNLETLLRDHPYTASIAFELGWMALLDDNASLASRYFKHAIAVAPTDPAGWYGWGVMAPRVEDAYGALSLAEGLATDEAQMRKLRERFPVAMMPIIGLDEDRFAVVSARARVRAAGLTNAPVPTDIKALAARPVPR